MSVSPNLAKAWKASQLFHGHGCPGLALGCRIAFDVLTLLGQCASSKDEEFVCVAETDSCAVDAIQVVTGCSLGKGNLLLRMRGKHAFTFYAREAGTAVRVVWRGDAGDVSREERIAYSLAAPASEAYVVGPPKLPVPEKALLSPSLICASCGEKTAEPHIRLCNEAPFCLDCYTSHSRVVL